MPSPIDTIKALFAAFAEGDMAAVLGMLTEDVSWEYEGPAEMLTAGIRHSRNGAMEFFSATAKQSSDLKLEVSEYFATEDAVAVFGRYQATVRATGIRVDSPLAQYFKLRDGKIARFVQLTNTGATLEAIHGRAAGSLPANAATLTENKRLITDYLNALSGKAKTADIVGKYVADDVLAKHIAASEAAFPEYELLAEEIFAEGDFVAVRGEFRGVQRGAFAGIAPTGKSVTAGLIIIYKVQSGKIVNHWMQFDTFGLLQQLQGDSQPTVGVVQRQLEAFGRSDINALVENCSSDCEIHSPGPEIIPYSGTMKGHAEIRGYFEKLIRTQSNANLSISQIVAQGNTVVVTGSYSAQVKATGKSINTPVALTFEIRGEKISRYMALADTTAVASGYTRSTAAVS